MTLVPQPQNTLLWPKVLANSLRCNVLAAFISIVGVTVTATIAADAATESTPADTATAEKAPSEASKIDYRKISNKEWRKKLTREQFTVTRSHGTEKAFSGEYHDSKKDGIYSCICCGQPLFDSQNKFDSGTGWPSYYRPILPDVIGTSRDNKLGYLRVEVHCSQCDAHLGHVFNDAPQTPTGLRYCMNSVALKLLSREEGEPLVEALKSDIPTDPESNETRAETPESSAKN